jgi:hypothetical protein
LIKFRGPAACLVFALQSAAILICWLSQHCHSL